MLLLEGYRGWIMRCMPVLATWSGATSQQTLLTSQLLTSKLCCKPERLKRQIAAQLPMPYQQLRSTAVLLSAEGVPKLS